MTGQDWLEKDFYASLGVSKDADAAAIKKAYRKLARQYHPDQNAGDAKAESRFKEIGEAYAVLSDPEKRRNYDATGNENGPGDRLGLAAQHQVQRHARAAVDVVAQLQVGQEALVGVPSDQLLQPGT